MARPGTYPVGLIRLYFGDRRQGKTTLAIKHALERIRGDRLGLIVAVTPTPREPVAGQVDPFGQAGFVEASLASVPRLDAKDPKNRALVFREDSPEAVAAAVELLARAGFRVVFLIDEADEALPVSGPPKGSRLEYMAHRNRHVPCDLSIITQWPADLAPVARKSRDEVYVFRLVDDINREWVRRQWGRVAANDVPFLPPHVYRTVTDQSRPPGWVRMY